MNDITKGLMQPLQRQQSATLNSLRTELGPQAAQTLDDQLEALSESELSQVQQMLRLLKQASQTSLQFLGQAEPYDVLIKQMYPRLPHERVTLLLDILQEVAPLSEAVMQRPKQKTYEEITASVLDDYNAILEAAAPKAPEPDIADQLIASAREYSKPSQPSSYAKQQSTSSPSQGSFIDRLTQSESGGNSKAEITIKDGRKYVGLLQFGTARLADYKAASGKRFTQDEFQADPALQDKVAQWHFDDIDQAIDALGDAGKGYDRNGLRSVAHLGGKGGMQKFVKSGGKYNPSDELGTSLQNYYDKFSRP